jgi:hypothetical protein
MKTIRNLLRSVFLVILVGSVALVAYSYRNSYRTKLPLLVENIKQVIHPKPCTQPIKYAIGGIDERFNVSQSKIEDDLKAAASLWNGALGRDLLVYSTTSPNITINLIYDYRQQATSQLQKLGITIKGDRATYDALKSKYDTLHASYLVEKNSLQNAISTYNVHKAAYEEQVKYWNDQGGAPPAEYEKMKNILDQLNAEGDRVKEQQLLFNDLVNTINNTVNVLNHLASTLNLHVSNYNRIGSTTGEEFNEGEYVEDQNGRHIDIYQFNNNGQLIRVFEHEFGHSIGLEHVDDPKAIMYHLNESTNDTLTVADLAELQRVCSL